MNPEAIAVLIPIVFILTTGGVILLRPLSKRLADLLEVMASERRDPQQSEEIARLRDVVEVMSERLALVEERQEFTDDLLRNPERSRLGGPPPAAQQLEKLGA